MEDAERVKQGSRGYEAVMAGGLINVIVALSLLVGADAASAKVPDSFWGIDPQQIPHRAEFARMDRGGITSVRWQLNWAAAEPSPGHYDWTDFDPMVGGAARRGMRTLPVVVTSPPWIAGDGSRLPLGSAGQRAAWQRFLQAAARRYGPKGSFWASRPSLDYRPIR